MKRKRHGKRIAGLAVVAALVIAIGWRFAERHAYNQVVEQLTAMNGGPVRVDAVRLGWSGIDVDRVRLLELGEDPPSWVTIEVIRLDLPIWRAVRSRPVPDRMILKHPTIQLRVSAEGQLLNRLARPERFDAPSAHIEIVDGRVEIRPTGREPLVASGIEFQIRGSTEGMEIAGTIGNLAGARWRTDSKLDGRKLALQIRVATGALPVDTDVLRKLPFASQLPSDSVRLAGTTAVSLAADYTPGERLSYRIELAPRKVAVAVAPANVRLEHFTGQLVLENGILRGEQLACDLLGGRLTLDPEFDLHRPRLEGRCQLAVSEIAVDRLPPEWSVPEEVRGKVSGSADLQLMLEDNTLSAGGTADGVLEEARLSGLPASPIHVELELIRIAHDLADSTTDVAGVLHVALEASDLAVADVLRELPSVPREMSQALTGSGAVTAVLDIPLQSPADAKTYTGQVKISLSDLSFEGQQFEQLEASANYAEGKVRLESIAGRFAGGGRILGQVEFPIIGYGQIDGTLTFELVPVSTLLGLTGRPLADSKGTAFGSVEFTGSTESWQDLTTWGGRGEFGSGQLGLAGYNATDVSTRVRLEKGVISLDSIRAGWREATLYGTGTLSTLRPYRFAVDFSMSETRLGELVAIVDPQRSPMGVSGSVAIRGSAKGEVQPLIWSAAGEARLRDVAWSQVEIPQAEFAWDAIPHGLHLAANQASLFGGAIDVDAELPFAGDRISRAAVTFRGVDIAAATATSADLPIQLSGLVDGELTVSNFDNLRELSASGEITAVSVGLEPLEIVQFAAEMRIENGTASCQMTGEVLEGTIECTVTAEMESLASDLPAANGRIELRAARLAAIQSHLSGRWQKRLDLLRGQVSAAMDFAAAGPEFRPEGAGTISLKNVRWGGQEIASQATAQIALTPDELEIRDFAASVGNGSVRGQYTAKLNTDANGTFRLTATRVNARRLLAPWPDAASGVEGTIDADIRGQLGGARWNGTAVLATQRTRVAGVPLRMPRLPLDWTFAPESKRGRVQLRESSIEVARGRVTGRATVDWGRSVNVAAEARLASLDTRLLLKAASRVPTTASGQLSGNLKLAGRNVRSFSDFDGRFTGELSDVQALRLPVLQSLQRPLDVQQLGSSRFDSSEVKLRLARGVIHVDRLAFANRGFQLLLEGHVTPRGRLDLDVIAHVGQFEADPAFQRLLSAAGLFTLPAAPVAVLAEANRVLADRLIFLHVGGTVRRPTTRLRAAPMLQQEIVQFFLNQATGGSF